MTPLAYVGLTLHGVLFVALVGVCAFDDGALAHDWSDCLIPLGFVLVPLVLAAVATARRSPGTFAAAAATGVLLGLLSITGPGLFVLVPSIVYGVAAAGMRAER
jgi:hypothetical protein